MYLFFFEIHYPLGFYIGDARCLEYQPEFLPDIEGTGASVKGSGGTGFPRRMQGY